MRKPIRSKKGRDRILGVYFNDQQVDTESSDIKKAACVSGFCKNIEL